MIKLAIAVVALTLLSACVHKNAPENVQSKNNDEQPNKSWRSDNQQDRPVTVSHDAFENISKIKIDKDDLINEAQSDMINAVWDRSILITHYTTFEIIVDETTRQPSFIAHARIYSAEPLVVRDAAFGSGSNKVRTQTVYRDVSCVSKCVIIRGVSLPLSEAFVSSLANGEGTNQIRLYTTLGHYDVSLNRDTVTKVYQEYKRRFSAT